MPVEDASRGSTVQEREAALAWLEHAARDEHQVARVQAARRPAARRPGPVYRPTRIGLTATAPRHSGQQVRAAGVLLTR